MRSLREYIKVLLIEKELRGQKDKRTLYHIGTHPADPKPAQTRHADQQWDRPWLPSPVKSGVFLTPNPINVAQFHGISGNVYAYRVPEWVIEKAGGIQRFDQGSEVLIPEGTWDEAGDEIEFLGKSMSEKQLWDKVELSQHSGGPVAGSSKKPGWMTDEEWKKSKKQSAERSYVSGLRSTKHLKNAIKMMTPLEREEALVSFESEAEKRTRSQEDILLPGREAPVSTQDQEIMAFLKKYMNESLVREYIREAMEPKPEPTRMPLNIQVPPDLRNLSNMFNEAGQELYIVGGAVRDTLLDRVPKDYDLATGAAPEVVIGIVSKDPGSKVDLTGKSFGVVRVNTEDGNEYEIATFRKDIGAGRRPDSVEFTTIEDDVKRRDLTINALFYDMNSGEVVDYVGGIEDIKSGVVKAVGDPAERFQEDKLRILRAVRFAGRMGSELDSQTEAAIMEDNNLAEVSPDRIRDELIKGLLSSQDVGYFLTLLDNLDLYSQIFPGLNVTSNTGTNIKDVSIQLALMLGNNDPDQVKSILKGMKYTNDEVTVITFLMKFLELTKESAPIMKKEFNRIKLDPSRLQEFAKPANVRQKVIDTFLEFVSAPPAASPRDLMDQGLKGAEIGVAIQTAESDAYEQMLGELRKYIRVVLSESRFKQMTKAKYRNLNGYLTSAPFMSVDAGGGDYEFDKKERTHNTDASMQLRDDLNDYFDQNMGNVTVNAIVEADEAFTSPDAGPKNMVKAADYNFKGGMHYINVLMAQLEDGHTYAEQFGPAGATRLAQVIRHELLHLNQFLQFSKGNPTEELYQEFMKEYGSAKGSDWQDEPYHTFDIGFSERETFAHQIADELVDELGLDGAMKILNQRTQVPHDLLQKNSDSYDMATEDLDDPNTESVKDMLSRARTYAIKIGKSR